MKLTPRRFDELSDVKHEFFTCGFADSVHGDEVLVTKFSGCCGIGCKSNGDCAFMAAMAKAGLEAFRPYALILDMSGLEYEWGDMMSSVLGAGDGIFIDAQFPTAVIVSDKCREGLTSLVRDEMGSDPSRWLFEDFSGALAAVESQFKAPYRFPQAPSGGCQPSDCGRIEPSTPQSGA